MENRNLKILRILTLSLAVCLAVVSLYGVFVPSTYERDAASMAAQGIGQDIVNLFFVLPLLLLTLIFMLKGSKVATFIFGGTLFYLLYSFVIYSFGVHFNNLFLLYCLTLGLSFYAFVLTLYELSHMEVQGWFGDRTPVRSVGIFLIIISAMFYLLWLKDIIPVILIDSVPQTVSDYKLLVNPVHVLDIAIVLPGLIITAILLLKKRRLGYILAPISLVFIIILAIALIAMVLVLQARDITDDISVAGIFVILAIISSIFLFLFLRNIKIRT